MEGETETDWPLREMEKEKEKICGLCDLCGVVGDGELLAVCIKCKTACQQALSIPDNKEGIKVPEHRIREDKDKYNEEKSSSNDLGERSHSKRQIKTLSYKESAALLERDAKKPRKSNLGYRSATRISSSDFGKPPEHERIQSVPKTSQQARRTPEDQRANTVKESSSCKDQKIASITSAKEFETCYPNMTAKEVKTRNRNAEEAVNKSPATPSLIATERDHACGTECSDTSDMEIDKEGGQDIGRVDKVVNKRNVPDSEG